MSCLSGTRVSTGGVVFYAQMFPIIEQYGNTLVKILSGEAEKGEPITIKSK
jgi:hypothetical protein